MRWWKELRLRRQKIQFIICRTCGLRHMLQPLDIAKRIREFELRHTGHDLGWFAVRTPDDYLELLALAPNADIKQAFGTSTAITLLLAGRAEGVGRQSTFVDNASDLFLTALFHLNIKLQTGTPASEKQIRIYLYGSEDGADYTDNATGTEGVITLRSPTNLFEIKSIQTPDGGLLTYKSPPYNVAQAFDGVMPRRWGVAVVNKTNLAFSATEGDHTKEYSGIFSTSA